MDVPQELLKDFKFKTDLKSLLRGLNSLLGLNMGMRSRLRSIRVSSDKAPMLLASHFDLIKFILVTEPLPTSTSKGIKYDENKDTFEFIDSLTGDTKEALFIYEDVEVDSYTKDFVDEKSLKDSKFHFYTDELSSLLDSSQINNGLVFLFHDSNGTLYVLNRSLAPDPKEDARFFFYTKLYRVNNAVINAETNFIEINRFDLSIKSHTDMSTADLSQMVLPVIHLYGK